MKLVEKIYKMFNSDNIKNSNTIKELKGHNKADYILFTGSFHENTRIYFEYAEYNEEEESLLLYQGNSLIGITSVDKLSEIDLKNLKLICSLIIER